MRNVTLTLTVLFGVTLLAFTVLTDTTHSQEITPSTTFQSSAANLIVPQSRSYAWSTPQQQQVQISGVAAEVRILEQVATTTMDVGLTNPTQRIQEAEMLIPVPDGAVVRSFTFEGSAKESTAKLLPKAEAQSIYRSIVSKLRDPALLEFAGYSLIRSNVFPIPAGGKQRVRIVYEHVLKADGNRIDYVLPRSESFEASATPWTISLKISSSSPISAVYSPSHQVSVEHSGNQHAIVRTPGQQLEPGPFRVSYLADSSSVTASLLAYPDTRVGGGYFLLLAGVPADLQRKESALKREVTLVLDRSGSMQGEKIEQARSAALQVLEGLEPGEAFSIIDYSDQVARFSAKPVIKDSNTLRQAREYIKRIQAGGGTNIHDALVEAMRQAPTANMLPLTIFLTDGVPTSGETREAAIRKAVVDSNVHKRRVFSFGVGYDLNAPLLTSIANATRATPTFVFPNENVEVKVSQVFKRLSGPVLAEPQLATLDRAGAVTTRAVRELLPGELSDLFEGDQLVVLGQYQSDDPLHFRLSGNYLGSWRTFDLKFDLSNATTRNAFVPRLWASRKIARLVELITEAGSENTAARPGRISSSAGAYNSSSIRTASSHVAQDPKLKELVDEIIRLSTEYGILTEYTAFLATDGTDFNNLELLNTRARESLVNNAQSVRSGMGSVSQASNNTSQKSQLSMNRSNFYLAQNMERVEITTVQQITDRTFFKRNNRWVDASALKNETAKPDQVIEFGTPEFDKLVDRLIRDGRQGILALSGEMLLMIDGKTVLVKAPPK
ncbi:MAG TPA: VIT and VWA domain-containing protein [Pyrinomonadaceae bacterium]|nr:VIT and VWA domain-containing protein [Pyrinomonadaceae bacterium]